jgi:hypothetical protein
MHILFLSILLINLPTFGSGFWSSHFFNLEMSERETFSVYAGCIGDVQTAAYCSGLLAINRFFLLTASNWHSKVKPGNSGSRNAAFPLRFRGYKSYLESHFSHFKNMGTHQFSEHSSAEELAKLGTTILGKFEHLKGLQAAWKQQNKKTGTYSQLISTTYTNSEEVLDAIKQRLDANQLVIAAQRLPIVDPFRMSQRVIAPQLPFIIIYSYSEPNISLSKSLYQEEDTTFYYLSTSYHPSRAQVNYSQLFKGFSSATDLIGTMNLGYKFKKEPESFKIITFDEGTLEDKEMEPEQEESENKENISNTNIEILNNQEENTEILNDKKDDKHKKEILDDKNNNRDDKESEISTKIYPKLEFELSLDPNLYLEKTAYCIMDNFLTQHEDYLENIWPQEKEYKYYSREIDYDNQEPATVGSSLIAPIDDFSINRNDSNHINNEDYSLGFFTTLFKDKIKAFPKHIDFVEYNRNIRFCNRDLNLEVQSIETYSVALSTIKKLLLNNQPVIAIRNNYYTKKREYILIKQAYTKSKAGKPELYYSYINGRDGQVYKMLAIHLLRQIKTGSNFHFVTWNRQLPDIEKESSKTDSSKTLLEISSDIYQKEDQTPPPRGNNGDTEVSQYSVVTEQMEIPSSRPRINSIDDTNSKEPESFWRYYLKSAQKKLSSVAKWFLSWVL